MSNGKKYSKNVERIDPNKHYDLKDAVGLLKEMKSSNFDESVDLAINLGVDPKHADQLVRGTVSLPNGTGKEVKVLVLAKDPAKVDEAKKAKADFFGFDEYVEKIKGGWIGFDVMVATPDMMAEVGKLGRVLGPRGLMPNPKSGTVTNDVEKAVSEIKAGKVEYRVEKNGIIHVSVGKISFDNLQIEENVNACVKAVIKSKPASVKGTYFKKISISSTMSPGVKLDRSIF